MDKNVCFRLKEERSNKNVTQKAIAKVTDVSEKTVSRWENGIPIPSDKLTLLSELGLNVFYILTGQKGNASLVAKVEQFSSEETELIRNYRKMGKDKQEVLIATSRLFADESSRGKDNNVTNIKPDNTGNQGYINQGNHDGDLSFGK